MRAERPPLERLLGIGLRLNALRSAAELHSFLVDAAAELSGATRVLLALGGRAGFEVAATRLPRGEDAQTLLQAVTPWLEAARRARSASLRHGPKGVAATDQRSCLIAPLIAPGGLLGCLYADIDGAFGRFGAADRDLLALLAAQGAVALANLHARERLEAEVAERAAEARSAQAQADRRASELSLIRGIQQGTAEALSFQAIVDRVGDKLRELFDTGDIHIVWSDAPGSLQTPYAYQHGERVRIAPMRANLDGVLFKTLAAGRPVVANNAAEMAAFGLKRIAGTDQSLSTAMVPFFSVDRLLGVVSLQSFEREGAFGAAEVSLLETVASGLGVALENVRLFNETQEALARQTATADVLQVISESPTDVQPVFDIIAERAAALTAARYCLVTRCDGEWLHLASLHGVDAEHTAALRDVWPQRLEGSTSIAARAIRQRSVINVADLLAESDADFSPSMKRVVALAGFRSGLSVPMLRDRQIVGAINVHRAETGLYADKEVALLQTFARQAVVAIENVRLFNETQDALSRQTATSDILRVISESPTDVQPVFVAIVETGVRLLACDLALVLRCDGPMLSPVASATPDGPLADMGPPLVPVDPALNFPARAAVSGQNYHVPDWNAIELPEHERGIQALFGVNSSLMLPLLRDGTCIGVLAFARKRAGAFDFNEIALAESFRDQAAIAIQNAQLFNETREALEQQIASAEVLRAITNSVSDAAPVFDTILDSCARLFNVEASAITLIGDDGRLQMAAMLAHATDNEMPGW